MLDLQVLGGPGSNLREHLVSGTFDVLADRWNQLGGRAFGRSGVRLGGF
jgi:hypothetical protein